jgi:hypothetical protein
MYIGIGTVVVIHLDSHPAACLGDLLAPISPHVMQMAVGEIGP